MAIASVVVLPAPFGAEQTQHGSGGHIEGETIDGDLLPELLAKPAEGRGREGPLWGRS